VTGCLFCRIAAGEIPCHEVARTDRALAFLDLHPIRPGHTLVIPLAHHDRFHDLPGPDLAAVMDLASRVARALRPGAGMDRVGLFFTGIHVAHAHAHVVPMDHVHDVTSGAYLGQGLEGYTVPPRADDGAMAALAAELRGRV
jgi:histidine triad (HIT) family protein